MPQPALVPWLADLTICSSTPREMAVTDLEVKVGVVSARGERFPEAALEKAVRYAEFLVEVPLVT